MASSGHAGDPPPEQAQPLEGESAESSANTSKRGSGGKTRPRTRTPKEKLQVRFGGRDHPGEGSENPLLLNVSEGTFTSTQPDASTSWRNSSSHIGSDHPSSTLAVNLAGSEDITDSREQPPVRSSRPLNLRSASIESDLSDLTMEIPGKDRIMNERAFQTAVSQHKAQINAQRLSRHLNTQPAPGSKTPSLTRSRSISSELMASTGMPSDFNNIPMRKRKRKRNDSYEEGRPKERASTTEPRNEAPSSRHHSATSAVLSGARTTAFKRQKWWHDQSTPSVRSLITSSTVLAQPVLSGNRDGRSSIVPRRMLRSQSTGTLDTLLGRNAGRGRVESINLEVHTSQTLSKHNYLVKLCEALIRYGAPTHRLEEYMRMSARVLDIQAQFFYIPTCMIIAFDDPKAHTTEIKLVRAPHGIDLGKLKDTHDVYKEVMHDMIGVDEAVTRLDGVMKRKELYGRWVLVVTYGLASASAAPYAFDAGLADVPVAFVLGALLGVLKFFVAPRSDLYTNIFEVSATVVTSLLARAFGSYRGGQVFCFSALAQSSLVLILPGFSLLCGCLELLSKNIVSGSVRVVHSVIYSLFIGFGITIGTALYAMMDKHATSAIGCRNPMPTQVSWVLVLIFTMCLIVIAQGRINGQSAIMVIISFVGYAVNHFAFRSFGANLQVSQALSAFSIGLMANAYSRVRHGLAAAVLLPAILVQAPSSLASGVNLVTSLISADHMTKHAGGKLTGHHAPIGNEPKVFGSAIVFSSGYHMFQVTVGITVGLFVSAAVMYPLGKRRSGLFTF